MASDIANRIAALSPEKRALLEKQMLRRAGAASLQTPIPRRTGGEAAPLSFGQQRLWFINQMEPGSHAYNMVMAFRLRGELHVGILERSLSEIVRRHEVLRTSYQTEGENPVQVIGQEWQVKLSVNDLRCWEGAKREEEIRRLVEEEGTRVFDLSCDLMLCGKLICEADQSWILALTTHHIASDGWSQGILLRELSVLYEAFLQGSGDPLKELELQYADYAIWQRERLQGEVLGKQLEYWKEQLQGDLPILELPTDRARPAVATFRGGLQRCRIGKELSEELKKLSRQEGVTFFMVLLAAFQVLLRRYTGQDDVIVGTPIAVRNRGELEGLIGFFLNTLALRTNLNGDPSFRQVLGLVKEVALGAYAHQEMPFEKLVEELHPERDRSRNPLFQVMFILQNTPGMNLALSGLQASWMEIDNATAKFDLTLSVVEDEGGLEGSWEYNADLFNRDTIERMARHYKILLGGVLANPAARISELPILDEAERRQLVEEWNRTEVDYPGEACLHHLVEKQAELTPDRIAVEFEGQHLTYRELNSRSNQLAHYLRKRNVGREVLVGVCLERSLDMVMGMLGILKAGGAYVPLDPDYPKERLAFMLEDSRAPVVVTQESLRDSLPASIGLVCLDTDWHEIQHERQEQPNGGSAASDLCYVIFTSGSTGKPKGVLLTHRNAVNVLMSICSEPGFSRADTMLAVTSLSFDISVAEIFLPLMTGGRLVIVSREVAYDGLRLLEALEASQATFMQPTPATWRLLLDAGWGGSPRLKMISTGEPLPRELADQLLPKGVALWNLYGPTETAIWSTGCRVASTGGPILIGRPVANTRLYVLDARLQPVPAGVPGELFIGGDGVARGYLNRPDLTAEKFIKDPFRSDPEARLYRTGDLVRYMPDGMLECLGRLDNQVKIRGFRIEISEVESVLMQHLEVHECVVTAREDAFGDKRLVAYLVTKQPSPEISDIKSFIAAKLPQYMVPSLFIVLDRLPRLPNGKINLRGLPTPDHTDVQDFVAPRNEAEARLAELWQEVLGLKAISVTANFFDEGGHSLLAARLLAKIERTFGRKMSLAAFLKWPTIETFADRLGNENVRVRSEQVHAIQPKGSRTPLFIVTSQPPLYRSLARRLGSDQPLFGITSPELSALPEQFTIQDIAANMLEALCDAQPQGPYYLGGWCMSGIIAYDMAQQLRSRGQEVALLAIFDSLCPAYARRFTGLKGMLAGNYFFYRKWLRRIGKMRRMRPVEVIHYAWNGVRYIKEHKQEQLRRLSAVALGIGDVDPGAELIRFGRLEVDASIAYEPKPFDSPVALFASPASKALMGRFHDPHLGWKPLIQGGLELHELPGGHEDIFHEPIVQMLAAKLTESLRSAKSVVEGKTLSSLASR